MSKPCSIRRIVANFGVLKKILDLLNYQSSIAPFILCVSVVFIPHVVNMVCCACTYKMKMEILESSLIIMLTSNVSLFSQLNDHPMEAKVTVNQLACFTLSSAPKEAEVAASDD